ECRESPMLYHDAERLFLIIRSAMKPIKSDPILRSSSGSAVTFSLSAWISLRASGVNSLYEE
ncbi:MAG: hypothetical protein AAFV36_07850, partial [Myxococcota bacterium]